MKGTINRFRRSSVAERNYPFKYRMYSSPGYRMYLKVLSLTVESGNLYFVDGIGELASGVIMSENSSYISTTDTCFIVASSRALRRSVKRVKILVEQKRIPNKLVTLELNQKLVLPVKLNSKGKEIMKVVQVMAKSRSIKVKFESLTLHSQK